MSIRAVPTTKGWTERQVGSVFTSIHVANAADADRAAAGQLGEAAVRSVDIPEVLVDTGASHLCLPADLVAKLGLRELRSVDVETAGGARRFRLMRGAEVTIGDRTDVFSCLETPAGSKPLLGVVVMEALGLQPDVQKHQLIFLPDEGPRTYITAL